MALTKLDTDSIHTRCHKMAQQVPRNIEVILCRSASQNNGAVNRPKYVGGKLQNCEKPPER